MLDISGDLGGQSIRTIFFSPTFYNILKNPWIKAISFITEIHDLLETTLYIYVSEYYILKNPYGNNRSLNRFPDWMGSFLLPWKRASKYLDNFSSFIKSLS